MLKIISLVLSILYVPTFLYAYTPPIGIPDPGDTWEGGLHPIDTPVPSQPSGWPSSEVPNHYYIDNSDINCTDSQNQYGYPDKPRCSLSNGTYPAGTYVEFHGNPTNTMNLTFQCTASNPCWIIGRANDPPIFTGEKNDEYPGDGRFGLINSSYVFVDGLEFAHKYAGAVTVTNMNDGETDHISVRNLSIHDYDYVARGSAIGVSARDTGTTHDVVVFNNTCERLGDFSTDADPDIHCVTFSIRDGYEQSTAHHLYLLENNYLDSTGSLIQVNAHPGGQYKLHHIYIGKNYGRNNKQRIIAVKQSSDVIVSQNDTVAFNQHWLDTGGVTDPFGWALSPDRVWYIFNKAYDASDGWRTGDSSGGGALDTKIFIIGNKIYNIKPHSGMDPHDPANEWRYGQGIHLKNGGSSVYAVDNTFYNCYGGISTHSSDNPTHVYGNIFYNIYPGDAFTSYQNLATADGYLYRNQDYNVFFDPDGDQNWRWGSTNYTTFTDWKSITGYDQHSQLLDPKFSDGPNYDFNLQSDSPAIDANNSPRDVYDLFQSLYGINIRVDFNGVPRPQGSGWDIGAFEHSGGNIGPFRTINKNSSVGELQQGTVSASIIIDTDENSTCKYSDTPEVSYSEMTNTFSTTGGATHSETITGMVNGGTYTKYIKCSGSSGDNISDLQVNLSVKETDIYPPNHNGWYYSTPRNEMNHNHTSEILMVATDEPATCRWSHHSDTPYEMMKVFSVTGDQNHYASDSSVQTYPGGHWRYFVKCEDSFGNVNQNNFALEWTQGGTGICEPDTVSVCSTQELCESNGGYWCTDLCSNEPCSYVTVGPVRSNGLPIGEQPGGTVQVTMSLTTDVAATCKYGIDGATGVDYANLANTFTITGWTSHSTTIAGLSNGNSYSRAVRCSDGTDNDTDYIIAWRVAASAPTTQITGTSPMIH